MGAAPGFPVGVSQGGNGVFAVFVGGGVGAIRGFGFAMIFLWMQESLCGVLLGLPGDFMPGQVNFFSVMLGAGTVGMCGGVVMFGGYLLRFAHAPSPCT